MHLPLPFIRMRGHKRLHGYVGNGMHLWFCFAMYIQRIPECAPVGAGWGLEG
jgi:hypothetical protein